jgi:hypothetical protein
VWRGADGRARAWVMMSGLPTAPHEQARPCATSQPQGARVDQPRLRVPLRQSGRGDDHAVLRTSPVASPARQLITSLTDTQYKRPPFLVSLVVPFPRATGRGTLRRAPNHIRQCQRRQPAILFASKVVAWPDEVLNGMTIIGLHRRYPRRPVRDVQGRRPGSDQRPAGHPRPRPGRRLRWGSTRLGQGTDCPPAHRSVLRACVS